MFTAKSNEDIITFSFGKSVAGYLDDISVYDFSISEELMKDGNFESGTLKNYCVCVSKDSTCERIQSDQYSGSYACKINSWGLVELSQGLKTIVGRSYNVSFWYKSQDGAYEDLYVFTSAQKTVN
ncbi:unnamed protein product [Rotaria magnacalcarata]|uniref:Uncharacterized protein n=1 Tax=Rotaria magnacalcarata TaxID=392030 RepID=A0A820I1E8_9BILA|nr:unnamed protein product [Rotaria magnacalcarata]CAF2055878.1 unnamed protein product [Rotaria magnacalcarata]CAF2063144.1 unnamed protein product [Rotaria magnacalcarata]CAF2267615.1 unnamed protein product [Rotaria magnacalcarata]CAF3831410.1 unnamed protein product [Rotaria magnacalcarata]